jgi:hypothetical protein
VNAVALIYTKLVLVIAGKMWYDIIDWIWNTLRHYLSSPETPEDLQINC